MFIVFEGGEGSGKSSQSKDLAEWLTGMGYDVVHTRNPGGCDEANQIRNILLTGDADRWDEITELLMFTADRRQTLTQVIEPALRTNRIVIADRYVASTAAYQGFGAHENEEKAFDVARNIFDLHKDYCFNRMPDMQFWLDIDPEAGLSRSLKRLGEEQSAESRFENKELEYHHRVRSGFQTFYDRKIIPQCRRIDAEQSLDDVRDEIRRQVTLRLPTPLPGPAA